MSWDKVKATIVAVGQFVGRNHAWFAWVLSVVIPLLVYYGFKVPNVPVPPMPPIIEQNQPLVVIEADAVNNADAAGFPTVHTGWKKDPAAVALVAATLAFPTFGDTPAGQNQAALPDHVYLWKAYLKIKGVNPPGKDQKKVGSCVGFGTTNAIERTGAYDIAFGGAQNEFKFLCEEITYAGSRVDEGHSQIRGDGSTGAWAAKFVRDYGVVSREKHGNYDLTEYSESRCRDWGSRGIPAELKALTRDHPVKSITQVQSWDEAKRALAQGYGVSVCSNQGFSQTRNAKGVASPQGSWGHCMCLDGYQVDADGKEYGHIENSWSESFFRGPVGWGEPSGAGFWADSKIVDRMLKYNDSWAFSALQGFPAKNILPDWYANRSKRGGLTAEFLFALAP